MIIVYTKDEASRLELKGFKAGRARRRRHPFPPFHTKLGRFR